MGGIRVRNIAATEAVLSSRRAGRVAKGWELAGSPSLTFNSLTGQVIAGQAVVKNVPGKEYDPEMKLGEQ